MIKVNCVNFDRQAEPSIRFIRHTVFTSEQNVDASIDFDGQDKSATHVIVYKNDTPVATGRMLSDGHIGRVAVLKVHRGSGYGALVISSLEEYAVAHKYRRIYLGSQLHAEPFYTKLGFHSFGEQYTEANIEHISMEKLFPPTTERL